MEGGLPPPIHAHEFEGLAAKLDSNVNVSGNNIKSDFGSPSYSGPFT